MPLAECQVQVRDLVMGPGTAYKVLPGFNPFARRIRADQGGTRAWNHGSWSGAEWMDEAVVPIPLSVTAPDRTLATWLPLHQALAAAFAPIGDAIADVEMRFALGGVEYVMFGRPRMVEPNTEHISVGKAVTQCAFVAPDPRIYAGTLSTVSTGLPTQTGGLTVPIQAPFTIDGTLSGGRVDLVNSGTTDTGVLLRIDGPVEQPWVAITRPDGTVQAVRMSIDLATSQYLEIDSAAGTVLLNGSETASQRHAAAWDMDPYPLQPGTNELRFFGSAYNVDAEVTAQWRSAWW